MDALPPRPDLVLYQLQQVQLRIPERVARLDFILTHTSGAFEVITGLNLRLSAFTREHLAEAIVFCIASDCLHRRFSSHVVRHLVGLRAQLPSLDRIKHFSDLFVVEEGGNVLRVLA